MSDQQVITLGMQGALIAMKIASPALLSIMVAGIVISVLQAATQINEQTLSFIPKIIAMTAAIFATAPWIIKTLVLFTSNLYKSIPNVTQ